MIQPVKLPKGWFLRDVEKAAKRAAQWAAPPLRKPSIAKVSGDK